ncbi:MAG: c-type cytochrome domain-containing protein, partial [Planctomycetota bacterium]
MMSGEAMGSSKHGTVADVTGTNSFPIRPAMRMMSWAVGALAAIVKLLAAARRTTAVFFVVAGLGCWTGMHAAEPAAESLDFNRDIRPILSENCFYCHGQDANKRQADLRLDIRQTAVDAKAIVPRDLAASELIQRIRSTDPERQMPPPKSNRRLTDVQRKMLERWIEEGAPYANHWAFVAPARPVEPMVKSAAWPKNAIDRFVLSKLESMGLQPSPEADRATLIKRLSIDLAGLPPTPAEVDA